MGKLVERMFTSPEGGMRGSAPPALHRKAEILSRLAGIAAEEKREAKRKAEAAKRQAEAQEEAQEALLAAMDADPVWASRLAAHESAHALFFLLSGQGCGEVGIRVGESGRLEGYSHGARGYLSPAGCLAGAAGEMLLLGDGEPCGSDLADYRKLCRAQGGSPEARMQSDLAQVVETLRPELRGLKRLRDEILIRGTLTGAVAERILTENLSQVGREAVARARQRTGWLK